MSPAETVSALMDARPLASACLAARALGVAHGSSSFIHALRAMTPDSGYGRICSQQPCRGLRAVQWPPAEHILVARFRS